jgi:hypothetical protein
VDALTLLFSAFWYPIKVIVAPFSLFVNTDFGKNAQKNASLSGKGMRLKETIERRDTGDKPEKKLSAECRCC